MRKIEDQIAKCSMLTAAVNGGIHPVDLFAQPQILLVVADAIWACLALMEEELG